MPISNSSTELENSHSSSTQPPDCEKVRHSLRAVYSKHIFGEDYHSAWLFKDQCLWASCPPGQCSGNRKKENQKGRLSSLKVSDTFSLIPFSLWDLTRKYRHCFGPFQLHNVSILFKIATSRSAFISMSLLKENCEDTGMRVEILIIHSHTHTKITPYLWIWKTSFCLLFISLIKKCHKKLKVSILPNALNKHGT